MSSIGEMGAFQAMGVEALMNEERLGDILIKEGLVDRSQIEEAARIQKELSVYKPIGQILIDNGALSQRQLNEILDRYKKNSQLGEILVRNNVITRNMLETALDCHKESDLRLGETLLKLNLVTEQTMKEALGVQLNIPFIDLERVDVDRHLKRYVNMQYAKKHLVVPIAKLGETLTVAMDDPTDISVVKDLQFFTGLIINVVTSTQQSIRQAIRTLYGEEQGKRNEGNGRIEVISHENGEPESRSKYVDAYFETLRANELFQELVRIALDNNATDIHLELLDSKLVPRFRIDGVLQNLDATRIEESITATRNAIISRIKVLGSLDIAEKRRPQDGSFRVRVKKDGEVVTLDLRISIIPGYHGESAVIRILDHRNAPMRIEHLGFSGQITEKLKQLLRMTTKIVLITGPTGSGKSTTLFGALMNLYRPGVKILTAEDPVEYVHRAFVQCEVNERIGNTFAAYLRSFLRHDPEVIMIGEIRDQETAEMAFRAAQTGHLLLSTLHTNDAVSSVTRLLNLGIDANIITSSLLGVLSQRLVRKICPQCRGKYHPSEELVNEFFESPPDDISWYKGKGCRHCNFTGYKGRIALGELWIPNEKNVVQINKGAPLVDIRVSSYQNTLTMWQEAVNMLRKGMTTLEELLRVLPYSSISYHRQGASIRKENQPDHSS